MMKLVSSQTSLPKFCVVSAISISFLNVIAFVTISLLQPPNAEKLSDGVSKILSAIAAALIGVGIHGSLTAVDGLKTELVQAVGEKEHAKGALEGLAVNPKTNVALEDLAPNILDRRKNGTTEAPAFERRKTDPEVTPHD